MTDKPRVLVVDDELPIQDFLKHRLKKLYEVSCATYQDDAFAALENSTFDLVLLDLKLPRKQSDMNPSTDVGVDILRHVRERKICRRGTAAPLPVVVMTAFGKDKLISAEFLQYRGACDYVQKPFGDGKALKKKIELALCNEGTFSAPTQNAVNVVQLRFDEVKKLVLVEWLEYTGAHYELLVALRDVFVVDVRALTSPTSFRGLRSLELASMWQIEDDAARRRVSAFRDRVTKDFHEKLGRVLAGNDVVENLRDWKGYRLNPFLVRVVAWEQEMAAPPQRR